MQSVAEIIRYSIHDTFFRDTQGLRYQEVFAWTFFRFLFLFYFFFLFAVLLRIHHIKLTLAECFWRVDSIGRFRSPRPSVRPKYQTNSRLKPLGRFRVFKSEKVFKWSSHKTNMAVTSIYGKETLKIFFSIINLSMTLKLGMWHWVSKCSTKMTLGLP